MSKKISFIIPAYNEEKNVGNCIASIQKELTRYSMESAKAEIIVVNNASTDRTTEAATKYTGVRVVDEPTKGLLSARQKGLMEARGELVAYLDADCILNEGWLDTVFAYFADPSIVALSGPRYYFDMPKYKKMLADYMWWLTLIPYYIVGYMILGGNFVARRDALEKMGGFDTSIKFYGEDTYIAKRLHKFGKVIFRMKFSVQSSGRRLTEEGVLKAYWIYSVNYIWVVLFNKPFTNYFNDVR